MGPPRKFRCTFCKTSYRCLSPSEIISDFVHGILSILWIVSQFLQRTPEHVSKWGLASSHPWFNLEFDRGFRQFRLGELLKTLREPTLLMELEAEEIDLGW